MGLLWSLIIGAVIGAIAGAITGRGNSMGWIANIVAGFLGDHRWRAWPQYHQLLVL